MALLSAPSDLSRLWFWADNATEHRAALGVAGAVPSATAPNRVSYPPEPLVVVDLKEALTERLQLSDEVDFWYSTKLMHSRWSLKAGVQEDVEVRADWAARLYPYQRVGATWLHGVQRGILGDDPGLGKTIQALTAAARAERVLIVTLNSVKQHWAWHCREWLGQEVVVAEGAHQQRQALLDSRPGWAIINHEMLRPSAGFNGLLNRNWDVVVFDEAHKFQGRKQHSQQSLGAEQLRSESLYMLTGTPVWNRPDSLWNLLHLIEPKRFNSFWRWADEYCDTQNNGYGTDILGFKEATIERLRSIVAPMLLRRRKAEVLPALPAKLIQTVEYDLAPLQRKQYRELKKNARLVGSDGSTIEQYNSVMEAFVRLRYLCDAPELIGSSAASPKNEVLADLLETLVSADRKVIVFTWYKAYANYLADKFERHGVVLVTGDTKNPGHWLEQFRRQEDKHVLVATIAATGQGIDLIEATAAIFAEGAHVPILNAQAEDRLHRIGQKTDVTIYRLQARNTIESALWEQNDLRQDMVEDLLSFWELIARVQKQGD